MNSSVSVVSVFRGFYKTHCQHAYPASDTNLIAYTLTTLDPRRFVLQGNLLRWYNPELPHSSGGLLPFEGEHSVEGCTVSLLEGVLKHGFTLHLKSGTNIEIYGENESQRAAFMEVLQLASHDRLWSKSNNGKFSIISITPERTSWRYYPHNQQIVTVFNDSQDSIRVKVETAMNRYKTIKTPTTATDAASIRDSYKKVLQESRICGDAVIPPGEDADFTDLDGDTTLHVYKVLKDETGNILNEVLVHQCFDVTGGRVFHVSDGDLTTPIVVREERKAVNVVDNSSLLMNCFKWLLDLVVGSKSADKKTN